MSAEEKLRRELILHLKTGSLDAAYFREKFDVEIVDHFVAELVPLLQNGLLQIEGDKIHLTREGLLQVDWLLPRFYLPEHVGFVTANGSTGSQTNATRQAQPLAC